MIENFVKTGIINSKDVPLLEKKARESGKKLVFLDATFVLPSSKENILKNYESKRIPGALFFDIKNIADKASKLPHMLPSADEFSVSISKMGIHHEDILIIYAQHGMIMGAARVWWMFKGFGHESVIVLNGGLPAWEKAGLNTESVSPPILESSQYKAHPFNPEMIVHMDNIIEASTGNACPIIDARPKNRFTGQTAEPREGMRSGHMPNAMNLPASSLVNNDGMLKPPEELETMFKDLGIFKDGKPVNRIITTCGSGITACALALALYHLDCKNVSVYDGSWSEWGLEASPTPVTTTSAG